MNIHIIGITVLLLAFVVTTIKPINLGIITLAGAFLVGVFGGNLSAAEIYGGFPANLFTLLVGVTLLFGLAKNNGTLDWLTIQLVRLVRGSDYAVPWIFFGITCVFSAIGSAYSVTMLAPLAMAYAAKHKISQFVMGVMIVHGQLAGGLFPISLYGLIIQGVMEQNGMESRPFLLFAIGFIVNVAIALALFAGAIVTKRFKTSVNTGARVKTSVDVGAHVGAPMMAGTAVGPDDSVGVDAPKFSAEMAMSLASIVLLIVGSIAFGFDLGLWAMLLVLVMSLARPKQLDPALRAVPWSVVVLVTGVLTFVETLRTLGTIDYIGTAVSAAAAPVVAALVLGYIGAVISAFATSSGVITALVPLSMPLLMAGEVDTFAVIALVAVASTIVDVSPFSTHGASIVAYATEDRRDSVFRNLLGYGAIMTVAMPAVVWAALVLPSSA